ncbi:MAG: AAA family ATPase [Chloroflexota bacterium]|nr:AAA family ATPase [Chloroflexota bacterium]
MTRRSGASEQEHGARSLELTERQRPRARRIWGIVKRTLLVLILLGVIVAAFSYRPVFQVLVSLLGLGLQLAIAVAFMIIQFVALFWFLSRSRTYEIYPGMEGITFDDYRGQPELVEQARQFVALLRGVKQFEEMGGEPLTGLLLEGPPGTGKTWLGQAISGEAGVPFFFVDASSLQAMFIGVGPMKVMRMYAKARKAAKEYGASIVFIDELDAIGQSRGGVSGTEQRGPLGGFFGGYGSFGLLSTLLIEMSGFSLEHGLLARLKARFYRLLGKKPPRPVKRVLTIGATNRVDVLDPALLRPGRFDKKITVGAPTLEGRKDILQYYLDKMAHDDTLDVEQLVIDTPGATPADLKYILNEALRHALFEGRDRMSYRDFLYALPEHAIGLRQPIPNMSERDKRMTAIHEAGHAVAAYLYKPEDRISRVTIVRYGDALGHVSHTPRRERYHVTQEDMENDICVALGGRAADELFYNTATTGAYSDLMGVRHILMRMAQVAMFETLGFSIFTGMGQDTEPSEELLKAMDELYVKLLERTKEALQRNRVAVETLAAVLEEKEELDAEEVKRILDLTIEDKTLQGVSASS